MWHPGKTEQPLWIDDRIKTPYDVIKASRCEDDTVEMPTRNNGRASREESGKVHGQFPKGKPREAYRSRTPERRTPSAIAVRHHRSIGMVFAGVHSRAVGRPPQSRIVGYGLADRNFNDKIRHGQDDLCNQHGYQSVPVR